MRRQVQLYFRFYRFSLVSLVALIACLTFGELNRPFVRAKGAVTGHSKLHTPTLTAAPIGTVIHGDHPAASAPYISIANSPSVPTYSATVGQATSGTRSPGSGSPRTGCCWVLVAMEVSLSSAAHNLVMLDICTVYVKRQSRQEAAAHAMTTRLRRHRPLGRDRTAKAERSVRELGRYDHGVHQRAVAQHRDLHPASDGVGEQPLLQ